MSPHNFGSLKGGYDNLFGDRGGASDLLLRRGSAGEVNFSEDDGLANDFGSKDMPARNGSPTRKTEFGPNSVLPNLGQMPDGMIRPLLFEEIIVACPEGAKARRSCGQTAPHHLHDIDVR